MYSVLFCFFSLTCLLLLCACLLGVLEHRVVVDVARMGRGGWWEGLVGVAERGLLLPLLLHAEAEEEEGRFNR